MKEKPNYKGFLMGAAIVAAFTIPIFRSGGRTHLTFFQWVVNHSIWGPAVEYVPEESYRREMEGVEITKLASPAAISRHSNIPELMAFYAINEESATKLANRGK